MSKLTTQLRTRLEGLKRTIIEASDKPLILVKELSPRSRRHLLRHFLALEEKDRLLRFGTKLSDELVTRYVEKIDFTRDTIFGVSVSAAARGMGVGTKLFERGAIHCRNADVDTLYMHCLSSNKVMMHIARKAGMEIHRDYGEADAYLKLKPANSVTVFQEAMEEQVAMIDYIVKANMRALFKWVGKVTGIGKPKS